MAFIDLWPFLVYLLYTLCYSFRIGPTGWQRDYMRVVLTKLFGNGTECGTAHVIPSIHLCCRHDLGGGGGDTSGGLLHGS